MEVRDIISRLRYFENRRKYPRVVLELPSEYRTEYSSRLRGGIVIDASEVGFLIHSVENMLVGTQLKITVLYPHEYSLRKLDVLARIVWKKFDNREKRYLYGLKINGIMGEDDNKLKGLLRSHSKPASPTPVTLS